MRALRVREVLMVQAGDFAASDIPTTIETSHLRESFCSITLVLLSGTNPAA